MNGNAKITAIDVAEQGAMSGLHRYSIVFQIDVSQTDGSVDDRGKTVWRKVSSHEERITHYFDPATGKHASQMSNPDLIEAFQKVAQPVKGDWSKLHGKRVVTPMFSFEIQRATPAEEWANATVLVLEVTFDKVNVPNFIWRNVDGQPFVVKEKLTKKIRLPVRKS